MTFQHAHALVLTMALSTASATASPVVYAITGGQQFGTVDLATGSFTSVGPGLPDGSGGLVKGPGGTLLTLTFSGNLNSINPGTGVSSLVGATGLGDCAFPSSPCGPNSANVLGSLGSKLYATDFANNLYSINPSTGGATLIGPTGIPALPFVPLTPVPDDPDGSFYFYDESLFSHGGNLYANFDTGTFDPVTFAATPVIDPHLYQIDPLTGHATVISPTTFGMSTIVNVGGKTYGFDAATKQVLRLKLSDGSTSVVSDIDPAAGLIGGAVSAASPVPEPGTLALVGTGFASIAAGLRRRWSRAG